jgi:predicted DNA-binding antitoxin AbrB/MazE fold protein
MTVTIKTTEAVYERGYLRPLQPIEERPGRVYIVTIIDLETNGQNVPRQANWRGKYRGYLSTSEEFSSEKEREKALEER